MIIHETFEQMDVVTRVFDIEVLDGDTVTMSMEIMVPKFGLWTGLNRKMVKLANISAPEKGTLGYPAAKQRLQELIEQEGDLTFKFSNQVKSGSRLLIVELFKNGISINNQLVSEGFAKLYL